MPVGTIVSRHTAQLAALRAYALAAGQAATGAAQREWYAPDPNGWAGNPLDYAGVAVAFDRAQAASLYQEALTGTQGSVGDAMALKLQSDYLAAQERSWRLRNLSPVRGVVHAGGRRAGHGVATVGIFDRVTQLAADLLVAGAAGWRPPQTLK